MTRGILLGLALALLLWRLGKALAPWWAPYHYEVSADLAQRSY